LNFEHTEYTVNEGSGTVTLNVLRQNGSSGAISVDCATLNVAVPNAATAGSDYVSKSVKLNWADGDSSAKSVTISIINDSAVEGDEIFGVGLSNQTGGATTGISLAGVTITDNDVSLTYPVTYNANGATSGSAPVAQTKTNNVILTIASNSGNLAKTGYTFAGWNTAANSSGTDYAAGGGYTANASVTLYAKWTVSSYTVTFDAQSGTAPSPLSKSVTYGSTYGALANTTRAGYLFGGWWTGSGGTGSEIIFSSTVAITSAQKLYAKWIPVYTLTVNNGIGGGPYASGDRVAISATVPSDKRFYRWLGATQYVDSVTSASTYVTMPAFDITLTATNRAIAMPWLNLLLD
jgi:uncharacterized repeat protein (TIGR02543 family)